MSLKYEAKLGYVIKHPIERTEARDARARRVLDCVDCVERPLPIEEGFQSFRSSQKNSRGAVARNQANIRGGT